MEPIILIKAGKAQCGEASAYPSSSSTTTLDLAHQFPVTQFISSLLLLEQTDFDLRPLISTISSALNTLPPELQCYILQEAVFDHLFFSSYPLSLTLFYFNVSNCTYHYLMIFLFTSLFSTPKEMLATCIYTQIHEQWNKMLHKMADPLSIKIYEHALFGNHILTGIIEKIPVRGPTRWLLRFLLIHRVYAVIDSFPLQ